MKCAICEKENPLFRGIYEGNVVSICSTCAQMENVTIIQRPTKEQLSEAERRHTVRETMERLSGHYLKRPIANIDHAIPEKNMEKIKVQIRGKPVEELIDNYYWEIKMARRRKKVTIQDLSKLTGVPRETLEKIEQGYLPKDSEELVAKIERALDVRLVKENQERRVKFNFPKKPVEKALIEIEKNQIKINEKIKTESVEEKEIREIANLPEDPNKSRIQRALERLHGKDKRPFKMESTIRTDPRKTGNLKNLTLNDITELKLKKDKESLMGNDVEIDE